MLPSGLSVFMDKFGRALEVGLDTELVCPLGTRAGELFTLRHNLVNHHRGFRLLGLGLLNEIRHPTQFIAFPLFAKSLIDPHHLAEELALGTPFLLGNRLVFLHHDQRHRESEIFGRPAHGPYSDNLTISAS